jgi:precorrin-6Y C5,15-methyltransferase (decarboxylating)
MARPDAVLDETAPARRWLSIVGIGEDGVQGLTPVARALVSRAEIVFGGKRHLDLAAPLIRGAPRPWPTPFARAAQDVVAERGRQVCALASGDPYCYGIGSLLARHIDPCERVAIPAPSAFSLAAAQLGWPLSATALISLCGRELDLVRPHLFPGARVLALTSDGDAPAALAKLLAAAGFGASRLTVLEALGGPRERVRSACAETFALNAVDPLNTVAIEVSANGAVRVIARAPGLPDDFFEHDGQITKREVRAVTLSSLAPRPGERLWDVGAGSGSVAIEWMLAHPALRAIAIESEPARAERIARNAASLGVPGLEIVEGRAPAALAGLPTPDAIFVGGGASEDGLIEAIVEALTPGGRLVANAVTLQSEAGLIERHSALGGELIRIAIARAEPLGGMTAFRPALPVTQWRWVKP